MSPHTTDIVFNAKWIVHAHTICAYFAFGLALVIGCLLHFEKIVENASFGYPDEWFPSVSAAIGDRYPERLIFQLGIALTAGPRFALLALNYIRAMRSGSIWPLVTLLVGFIRTVTCGGWVYITLTDDHDWHDIFMIAYIILTIPWTIGTTCLSPKDSTVRSGRFYTGTAFFVTLIPLIYWFIQHKVYVRPGAYTVYAFFEWLLIFLDVAFDAWLAVEYDNMQLLVSSTGLTVAPARSVEKPTPIVPDSFTDVQFIVNICNSFSFFSVCTSLLMLVWYFPLWYMGISGYEAAALVWFVAPLVLVPTSAIRFFASHPWLPRSLMVVLGIGAYKIDDVQYRLMLVSAATGLGVIANISELYAVSNYPRKYHSLVISSLLGLFATTIIKFAWYSNNPIWPNMRPENGGINAYGLALGLISAIMTPTTPPFQSKDKKDAGPVGGSLILAAIGFGAHFFSLQSRVSDSATMVMWVWDGFPVTGPTPITGLIFFFGAVSVGIVIGAKTDPSLLCSLGYNLVLGGLLSAFLFYLQDWPQYVAASVHIVYLVLITPAIVHGMRGYRQGIVYLLAFLVYCILVFADVWTVAYAFVPGGPLLRERTDIIVAASMIGIFAGVFNFNWKCAQLRIISINYDVARTAKQATTIVTVLLAVGAALFWQRVPPQSFDLAHANTKSFNAGIWCVHFGLDNDMWASDTRMRDLIKDAELDIVGLLESDTQRMIGGYRDFTQTIAHDLGMNVDYGPGPNQHTWGAALLSKFPILNSTHHLLPSPVGELAPAIHATLDIYGQHIDVVVFHSGQEDDEEDRRLQSLELQRIMGSSQNPLVLLSYLVVTPHEGNYHTYASEALNVYDIDSTDWDRWCEYIMFRGLKKVAYARVSRLTITDTELQFAKFQLLLPADLEENDTDFLYGNDFVDESLVEPALRMPSVLRGEGVRGHQYHVFDEPRYFAMQKGQASPE